MIERSPRVEKQAKQEAQAFVDATNINDPLQHCHVMPLNYANIRVQIDV